VLKPFKGDELKAGRFYRLRSAEREIVLVAAIKLFEVGRLSSGAAAQLAGLPTLVFLIKLADYGVPVFRLTEGDVARDAQNG
jgi:predicted HTH domain antitoxin